MIHVIVEINEKEMPDKKNAIGVEAFIKGDSTSTDKEFQLARVFMDMQTVLVKRAKTAWEKAGGEVANFSEGGVSLKPKNIESEDK
ncbi:MAG: hypothetical protein ACP5D6_10475 [Kosmotogaceae bacterium]